MKWLYIACLMYCRLNPADPKLIAKYVIYTWQKPDRTSLNGSWIEEKSLLAKKFCYKVHILLLIIY